MKTTVKLVLTISVIALCSNVSAQNLKLAHINLQELITTMPEYDSAMVKLQKYAQDLEKEIESMQVELNRKQEDFSKNSANLTDIVRSSKEQELMAMYQRVQNFQQQAQESYQQENQKLIQPVIEQANKAIETVAKEQGITYVLDNQAFHYKAVGTVDLLPAVKKHLGIN
jgi:outer membrane protein